MDRKGYGGYPLLTLNKTSLRAVHGICWAYAGIAILEVKCGGKKPNKNKKTSAAPKHDAVLPALPGGFDGWVSMGCLHRSALDNGGTNLILLLAPWRNSSLLAEIAGVVSSHNGILAQSKTFDNYTEKNGWYFFQCQPSSKASLSGQVKHIH